MIEGSMEAADALSTISEIALGLAGFTGVAVLFGRVQDDPLMSMRLQALLLSTLGVVFMSLLPFALWELPIARDGVWLVSNGVLALYGVLMLAKVTPTVLALRRIYPTLFEPWAMVFAYGCGAATSLAGVIALAMPSLRVGCFVIGQLTLLGIGAFMFVRIIFRQPKPVPEA